MEKKLTVSNSMPTFAEEEENSSGSIFSAATHPSVLSRNKDDLFKRIRSGNDVLSRLPERLDPNIQFSEDEDDEDIPQNKENENKFDRFNDSVFTAATHFSVTDRRKEDIVRRIRSGTDVLSRLPERLNPNVKFSVDEDEDIPQNKVNESKFSRFKAPNLDKTPELRPKLSLLHHFQQTSKPSVSQRHHFSATKPPSTANNLLRKGVLQSEQRRRTTEHLHDDVCPKPSVHTLPSHKFRQDFLPKNFTPKGGQFQQHHFSATKPPSSASNFTRKAVPQSEQKPRVSESLQVQRAPPTSLSKTKLNLMNQPEFKVPLPTKTISPKDRASSNETIVINGKPYSVLQLLGSGGSCKVYSVFDAQKNLVAVKCVDLKGTDPLIREGYEKEIEYLQKLQGSNRVIRLFDYEYRENELFLVLERGDIDFARYIANKSKEKRLTPLTIKFFWAQMLEAVSDIHKYGIVHSDLKPANFLLVSGNLKLIDFGIATSVPEDKTSTFRDTQVGTLNYMSPEAVTQLNGDAVKFKVGVKSDVWSLGCILYTLVYGMTPFQSIKTLMQKIYAITNPNYKIEFKPYPDRLVVDVLQKCLQRDPKERASVEELLMHPYLKEDKPASTSPETAQSKELSSVMAQMQVLTPRRMSYLTKVVRDLSEKQN